MRRNPYEKDAIAKTFDNPIVFETIRALPGHLYALCTRDEVAVLPRRVMYTNNAAGATEAYSDYTGALKPWGAIVLKGVHSLAVQPASFIEELGKEVFYGK